MGYYRETSVNYKTSTSNIPYVEILVELHRCQNKFLHLKRKENSKPSYRKNCKKDSVCEVSCLFWSLTRSDANIPVISYIALCISFACAIDKLKQCNLVISLRL